METKTKIKYDLEDRTFKFAKDVRGFVFLIPKTISNIEDIKQLVRSSGSVGANYIEANECLGVKDFLMRIKISRKEAKESRFWLELLSVNNNLNLERLRLSQEAMELTLIFSAIMRKQK
jgi:four helix bundle protein